MQRFESTLKMQIIWIKLKISEETIESKEKISIEIIRYVWVTSSIKKN